MTLQEVELAVTNAQTLEELLKCLEDIEKYIWSSTEYKKVYSFAMSSKLLDKIKAKAIAQELIPILEEYVDTKSSLEILEEKCKEFVFIQLTFVISSAISLLNDTAIQILNTPNNSLLSIFVNSLFIIGTIFTAIFPIEIIVFGCYLMFTRPKQIRHKAFYNFALKKL